MNCGSSHANLYHQLQTCRWGYLLFNHHESTDGRPVKSEQTVAVSKTFYAFPKQTNFQFVVSGPTEVDIMTRTSILVFEVLEKVWATRNCALIDMKIEFGVDTTGKFTKAKLLHRITSILKNIPIVTL
jgi:hypothetical protein